MGWNYFKTSHGKGQWMGLQHVKNALRVEEVKTIGSTKLQNALDVCNFSQTSMGKAHLAYPKAQ
jgi:hypothetical protein